jgi:hypothetical protein
MMTIKDRVTTEGGGRGYSMIASKWYKNKNGKPAVVTTAREEMMDKLGRPLKTDEIVHHATPGSHSGKEQGELAVTTRGENTATSNRLRKNGKLYRLLHMRKSNDKQNKD